MAEEQSMAADGSGDATGSSSKGWGGAVALWGPLVIVIFLALLVDEDVDRREARALEEEREVAKAAALASGRTVPESTQTATVDAPSTASPATSAAADDDAAPAPTAESVAKSLLAATDKAPAEAGEGAQLSAAFDQAGVAESEVAAPKDEAAAPADEPSPPVAADAPEISDASDSPANPWAPLDPDNPGAGFDMWASAEVPPPPPAAGQPFGHHQMRGAHGAGRSGGGRRHERGHHLGGGSPWGGAPTYVPCPAPYYWCIPAPMNPYTGPAQ